MREEFGFVRRDIDADGAVTLAAFAGEAEIEGVFDFFALPAVADDGVGTVRILRHLPEEMGAAAGGVFFFMRGAPAGAHDAAFFAAALADTDAAQRGMTQAAVVEGELKVRLGLPRCVVLAEAEISVELVGRLSLRANQLARVHIAVGIPGGFEFAEGLH